MQVNEIGQSQNFKALNLKKVAHEHRGFIRKNLPQLKELGEKYDITMRSFFNHKVDYDCIEITVKDLKEKLPFLERFNRNSGKSIFHTFVPKKSKRQEATVLEHTLSAIDNLRKVNLLSRISGKYIKTLYN